MSGKIILVRHAMPTIEPGAPSSLWRLSPEGHSAATAFAAQLRGFDSPAIWTSPEPKAASTAHALAAILRLSVVSADGLREHERTSAGYLSRENLESGVARLVSSDDELVFGDETAAAVFARFSRALAAAQSTAAGRDVIAVTHGAAMSIFVGRRCAVAPLAFWQRLGTPCAVVLHGARIERILPSPA